MTKYTDEQIAQAMQTAAAENTAPPVYASGFGAYKKVINALPDVPHCGDCAVDRAKAGVYEQLLDHPFFEGWSEADESVADYMIGRLNEAHAAEQDDWQECAFEDVKDTDLKVRAEYPGWTAEGKPQVISSEVIKLGTGQCNDYRDSKFIREMDHVTLFRIPAPVQHPDPVEHPVIIIRGGDIYDGIPMPQDAMWTGTSYESRTHSFEPGDITDWSPAKVVAADDR